MPLPFIKNMYLEPETMHFFRQIAIPRKVGTEGHLIVNGIIKEKFQRIEGLQFHTQKFQASNFYMGTVLSTMHPFIALLAIASAVLILNGDYRAGNVLSIITWVIALFNRNIIWFLQFRVRKIGKTFDCENIIGYIPPKHELKQNVVFVAHYDTISHELDPIVEGWGYFAGFIGMVIYSINLYVISWQAASIPGYVLNAISFIWGIPLVVLALLGLINRKRNFTKGVLDNASGIAQLYDLAKKVARTPLKNTGVYFLCSDGEELGDFGAYMFFKENKFNLSRNNTHSIVVDSIGAKKNNIILNAFSLPKLHFGPEVERVMEKVMEDTKPPIKFQWIPPLLQIATDHVPIVRLRYKAIVVACSSFVFHGESDNWNEFDQKNYEEICKFLENTLRKFDSEQNFNQRAELVQGYP